MAYYDITPTRLAQAAMTTSYATVYTVPVGFRTFVKDVTIVNTTSAAINIYVSLVPKSGTAGTDNAIFYANALPANTTVEWCGAQIINEEAFISVKASAVGCTVNISGGEAI
jgi:hypothetical protein